MRLVSFRPSGEPMLRSGIETAAGIADTEHVAELAGFGERGRVALRSTRDALALGRERLGELGRSAESLTSELQERGALPPRDNVQLGPPVPDPQKIICLGLNYRDHAREAGLDGVEFWHWRDKLFILLSNVALDATEFFRIPPNRVIELGGQIEI